MTYARIKRWSGGAMDGAAVDYEINNLYNQLNNSADPSLFASVNATFLTATSQASLPSSRTLTGTSGQITLTDNGAASTEVISLPDPLNPPGVVNVPNTKLQAGGNQVLPILQIVTGSTTTSGNTSSTSFTNTNLSASITPKFNTSKILIFAQSTVTQNVGDGGFITIARGSTNLAANTGGFFGTVSGNNYCMSIFTYDSPATTSSTTYNVQYRTGGGGATIVMPVTLGGVVPQASIILVEIAQ